MDFTQLATVRLWRPGRMLPVTMAILVTQTPLCKRMELSSIDNRNILLAIPNRLEVPVTPQGGCGPSGLAWGWPSGGLHGSAGAGPAQGRGGLGGVTPAEG